jgi:hypothetical protein
MTAVEAEAAGALDAWLTDALSKVEQRLSECERREKAVSERAEIIRQAVAEVKKGF